MDRTLPGPGLIVPDHHDGQRALFLQPGQFFCRAPGYVFIFIRQSVSHGNPGLSQTSMTEHAAQGGRRVTATGKAEYLPMMAHGFCQGIAAAMAADNIGIMPVRLQESGEIHQTADAGYADDMTVRQVPDERRQTVKPDVARYEDSHRAAVRKERQGQLIYFIFLYVYTSRLPAAAYGSTMRRSPTRTGQAAIAERARSVRYSGFPGPIPMT